MNHHYYPPPSALPNNSLPNEFRYDRIPQVIDGRLQWPDNPSMNPDHDIYNPKNCYFMRLYHNHLNGIYHPDYFLPQNAQSPVIQPSEREKQLENELKALRQKLNNFEISSKQKEADYLDQIQRQKDRGDLLTSLFKNNCEENNRDAEKWFKRKDELKASLKDLQQKLSEINVEKDDLKDEVELLKAKLIESMEENAQLKADKIRDDSTIKTLRKLTENVRDRFEESSQQVKLQQEDIHRLNEANENLKKELQSFKDVQQVDLPSLIPEFHQIDSQTKAMMITPLSPAETDEDIATPVPLMSPPHSNQTDDQCVPATHPPPASKPVTIFSSTIPASNPAPPTSSPEVSESFEILIIESREFVPSIDISNSSASSHQHLDLKQKPSLSSSFPQGGGRLLQSPTVIKACSKFSIKSAQFFRHLSNKKAKWKFNKFFAKLHENPEFRSRSPSSSTQVPRGSKLSKMHTDAIIFHYLFKQPMKAVVKNFRGIAPPRRPPFSCCRSVRNFCNEIPAFQFFLMENPIKPLGDLRGQMNPYKSSPNQPNCQSWSCQLEGSSSSRRKGSSQRLGKG